MAASSRYDNLIKKFVKEANKRPVTVDGQKVEIPWQLIKAMMLQESGGNTNAESDAGALGLMQVIPPTAREMGVDPDDLSDPKVGIRTGVKYYKRLLKYYDGDFDLAISAYNAGMGNVNKGVKKYGRQFALKYTHGNNFARHEEGHKDEGQSQTQAYNRRIRDYYRGLTGSDLPGDSYYDAVQSLGLKYDKFAANRKGAFDRLDQMPVSEMIAGIGSGELDRTDLGYIKEMAEKRGRSDLAKDLDEALAYDPSRAQVSPEGDIVDQEGLDITVDRGTEGRSAVGVGDVIFNPNRMPSEEDQLQRLTALDRYLDQLNAPPQEVIAQRPSVEFGEPTITRPPPSTAGAPAGVALTSPVGVARAAQAAVAPKPEPPVLVVPEVPVAPPAPVPSVNLQPWEAVVAAEQANQPQRTAPAVRTVEPNTMAKKRPINPALVAIEQARATNAANQNAAIPAVVGAPSNYTSEELDQRTGSSIAYQLLAQEYNANLPGSPLSGEEEFLRDAAMAQYLGDIDNRKVGFAEAFAGGMVDRNLIQERQQQNQGALQRYRKAVGLGAGKSRRQLRAQLAAKISEGPEARSARALENEFAAKRDEVAAQNQRGTLQLRAKLDADAKAVDVDLAQAESIDKALQRAVTRRGQNVDMYKADAGLLNTLLKGQSSEVTKSVKKAFAQGGGKEMSYVKRLYDGLEKNSQSLVELQRQTTEAQYKENQRRGADDLKKFAAKYVQMIRLTTANIKTAAQLTALNKGTPQATVSQSTGLLAGLVAPGVMEAALTGSLGTQFSLKKSDLLNAIDLERRVGKNYVSIAMADLTAQLRYISMMEKYKLNLEAKGGPESEVAALNAARAAALDIEGPEAVQLLQMMEAQQFNKGYRYNTTTKTYEKIPEDAGDSLRQDRSDGLIDRLLRKNYGKGLSLPELEAQRNLGTD